MKKSARLLLGQMCAFCLAGALMGVDVNEAQNLDPPPPPPKVFGLIGITATQTARVHFANLPKIGGPSTPVWVQLQLLNSAGQPLLNSDLQPILPTAPILVQPGRTASIELLGESLHFPEGSNSLLIQPVVQILQPFETDGIATLEMEDSTSALKLAVRLDAVALRALAAPVHLYSLGPVSLQANETARLNPSSQHRFGGPLPEHWTRGCYFATLLGRSSVRTRLSV